MTCHLIQLMWMTSPKRPARRLKSTHPRTLRFKGTLCGANSTTMHHDGGGDDELDVRIVAVVKGIYKPMS